VPGIAFVRILACKTIARRSDRGSLTAAPEPSTWAMLLLGFAGPGYAAFRARRSPVAAVL
jgi:hypothetical protein